MNTNMKWVLLLVALVVALYSLNKLFGGVLGGIDKGVKTTTDTLGKVTDNFGITSSSDANELQKLDCWNPKYYVGKNAKILTAKQADLLATKIYDARTLKIYTDDDAIFGVIKQLKAWTQISFLCDVFYKKYQTDMLNYFWGYMVDRVKRQMFDFINKLPKT